jgi:hypothetical protein
MLHTNSSRFLTLIASIALFSGCSPEDDCECHEELCQERDLFDITPIDSYPHYGNDKVSSIDNFGLYTSIKDDFTTASLQFDIASNIFGEEDLKTIGLPPSDLALALEYETITWLSVRRGFYELQNLCGCSGIQFDAYKIDPNSDGTLRLTIADLACSEDSRKEDELWWSMEMFDILSNDGWQTVKIPFKSFDVAYGTGTRQNDYKLGLGCALAIEFNFIDTSVGSVLIRNVRTYGTD